MKSLYLGQKPKTPSSSSIHNSDIMNSSADESRADSNSKRFARKQGIHLEHSRTCKTPKMGEVKVKRFLDDNKPTIQPKKLHLVGNGFIRQEDLFLKISSSSNKSPLFTPPISTDRNTETTSQTKVNEIVEGFDIPTTKKRNFDDMEEELELKMG